MTKSNRSLNVSGGNGRGRIRDPFAPLQPSPGLTGMNVRAGRNRTVPARPVRDGKPIRDRSGFTQGGAFDPRGT